MGVQKIFMGHVIGEIRLVGSPGNRTAGDNTSSMEEDVEIRF